MTGTRGGSGARGGDKTTFWRVSELFMTEFQISSNLIFGAGSTDALGRYCKKNVTVITDAVMKETGICDRIVNLLMAWLERNARVAHADNSVLRE